mmetsp:Transcript_7128/g.17897  ORF Transcript_7128/g.17897 Transcript_7128/m.17897 type:complete len:138 (-) Transcript_7128:412-825(-)
MMRYISTFLLFSMTSGFRLPNHVAMTSRIGTALCSDRNSDSSSSPVNQYDAYTDGTVNPCWQDIYDADCTMDSIFTARFVASEWIKELPCGSGMEDCDFPKDTVVPEMRPEAHEHPEINVMDFLNIKRVDDDAKLSP